MRNLGDADAAHGGVVAIIPARGGSKGVPGKNLRRVGGVPLIARAVASARRAALVDRVLVSTDDPAIAAEARRSGAEPMARSARLSGDAVGSEAVLLDVLERIRSVPEIVVMMQATSPFIDPADVDSAIKRVRDGEVDVVFSAVATHSFIWSGSADAAVGLNHDHTRRARRQDREEHFQETGAFYVMRGSGFLDARFRFFGRIGVGVTDPRFGGEIDTEGDLEVARLISAVADEPGAIDVDALVTDFDGVHIDDRILVDQDGRESVLANRSDGVAIKRLRMAGVPVLILSTEVNGVVGARASKLRVEALDGIDDKSAALSAWLDQRGLDPARVAYLANDVNDLGAMDVVGWPIAVADAHPHVLSAARVVLSREGGRGAVREVCERILGEREQQQSRAPGRSTHSGQSREHSGQSREHSGQSREKGPEPWRYPLARTR